jgi:hypothetical protein
MLNAHQLDSLTAPPAHGNESLPQEVVDGILDALDGDLDTLKQASFVARTWYHRTRELFFRCVRLEPTNGIRRGEELLSLVENHPDLSLYIKHLTLTVSNRPPTPWVSSPVFFLEAPREIGDLLYLLTHLTEFTLEGSPRGFDWQQLPRPCRQPYMI